MQARTFSRSAGLVRPMADALCAVERAWFFTSRMGRRGLYRLASGPISSPDSIITAAGEFAECRGVLFDTWNKKSGLRIDDSWQARVDRVRDSGQFVAIAGSLNIETIQRLAGLEPDIVAVRGAACAGGDRLKSVDSQRVSDLAQVAGSIPARSGVRLDGLA